MSYDLQTITREEMLELIRLTAIKLKGNHLTLIDNLDAYKENYSEQALRLVNEYNVFADAVTRAFENASGTNMFGCLDDGSLRHMASLSLEISDAYELGVKIETKQKIENVKRNKITKIKKDDKIVYEIDYDRNIEGFQFYDLNGKLSKENKILNTKIDLYRNFATALGFDNLISDKEIKEAMLDNGYCFIKDVGWISQDEYIEHQKGIRELIILTENSIPYGIYEGLRNSITNKNIDFIDNLSSDKVSETVKNKWKALIEKSNDLKNFELKVIYKESENKLRVYYRIKNDESSKIEILSIDALSQVLYRECPVGIGEDKKLSVEDALKNRKSVCKTSPNGKYYVPQKFPKNSSGKPWHIISIDDLNDKDDPVFIGPKKIRTDAYINVNVWRFGLENEKDKVEHWIETSEKDKDEGYLIHGGDGSSQNKDKYDATDKKKGNNRYNTTTQGCIRINNRDVYLLIDLFNGNLPIELEVF